MPHERAAILRGRFLGVRVLPRKLVLRRQDINQAMPADGLLLALTGRFVVWIPEKPWRNGIPNETEPGGEHLPCPEAVRAGNLVFRLSRVHRRLTAAACSTMTSMVWTALS